MEVFAFDLFAIRRIFSMNLSDLNCVLVNRQVGMCVEMFLNVMADGGLFQYQG